MKFFIYSSFIFFGASLSLAAHENEDLNNIQSITSSTVVSVYLILILLAAITAYFLWKKGNFKIQKKTHSSGLKILENRILGPKQCLMVLEYEGEKMLLGVSPGIIQHLCFLGKNNIHSQDSKNHSFENLLQVEGLKEKLSPQRRSKKAKA